MDKTLKRQIGYRPGKAVAEVLEDRANNMTRINTTKKTVAPKKEEPKPREITAKEVIAWIKNHPMFKWGAMCIKIGLDKGNFSRTMASKEPTISPEVLTKIINVIKEYGFQ